MDKNKNDTKLESEKTQEDSSTEQKTPDTEAKGQVDSKVVKKLDSESEELWDSLAGKTQDRIVKLIRENKALKEETARSRSQPENNTLPVQATATSETEVKEAITKLREFGVVTTDDLNALQDRMFLDREHENLEKKYDGSDNRPKYVREEVEQYARESHIGNLGAAYKDMYWDELLDAELKKRGPKKSKTYTEKPTSSVKIGEKPLTVESLRERLRQPDGGEWWIKNRAKIEPLLPKLSQV